MRKICSGDENLNFVELSHSIRETLVTPGTEKYSGTKLFKVTSCYSAALAEKAMKFQLFDLSSSASKFIAEYVLSRRLIVIRALNF